MLPGPAQVQCACPACLQPADCYTNTDTVCFQAGAVTDVCSTYREHLHCAAHGEAEALMTLRSEHMGARGVTARSPARKALARKLNAALVSVTLHTAATAPIGDSMIHYYISDPTL